MNVLVTGADAGLGHRLVGAFAADGHLVIAGCRQQPEIAAGGGWDHRQVRPVRMDVTSDEQVEDAAALVRRCGGIDVVVCNAAICSRKVAVGFTALDLSDGEPEAIYAVNVIGVIRTLKHMMPLLCGRRLAVFISSEAGSVADNQRTGHIAYSASKAALNMVAKLAHNTLLPTGGSGLVIHPGWMRTAMGGSSASEDPQVVAASIVRMIAVFQPGEVLPFMDWLGRPMRW